MIAHRCIQLERPGERGTVAGEDGQEGFAELTDKIRESVLATFDANVAQYEEDVRKVGSQRQLPGWNFCTFFVQKVRPVDRSSSFL